MKIYSTSHFHSGVHLHYHMFNHLQIQYNALAHSVTYPLSYTLVDNYFSRWSTLLNHARLHFIFTSNLSLNFCLIVRLYFITLSLPLKYRVMSHSWCVSVLDFLSCKPNHIGCICVNSGVNWIHMTYNYGRDKPLSTLFVSFTTPLTTWNSLHILPKTNTQGLIKKGTFLGDGSYWGPEIYISKQQANRI